MVSLILFTLFLKGWSHDDETILNDAIDTDKALFTHEKGQLHCPDRDLFHGCVSELKDFISDKNDTAISQLAYNCVEKIYQNDHDFFVVKNMTHLLLDLDSNVHVFDDQRDNKFIELGYKFAEKLIFHPDCTREFDEKDELECRCPLLFGKIILLKLKNANQMDRMFTLFNKLKKYEWNGSQRYYRAGKAFPWKSYMQTPQVYMENLTAEPVWSASRKKDLPIWDQLESNFDVIQEETAAMMERMKAAGNEDLMEDAYRFLFTGGKWNQVVLYHGRNFTEQCTEIFPKTCALLKEWLPAREVHHMPWTSNQNEQVIILKMTPGTDVETHSGPANNILNIHLGISGLEKANLVIAGKRYKWEEGKVIAWDGSFDHKVDCLECKEDRIVMLVRYMHPEVTWDHYKGNKRTHFEEIPEMYQ